jgi:hypothetical protein
MSANNRLLTQEPVINEHEVTPQGFNDWLLSAGFSIDEVNDLTKGDFENEQN